MVVAVFYCISLVAKSQNLTVEGAVPALYISHQVAPKENFYSISRLYNQPPKFIAAFNKIEMEKGLTIGQHVKVPVNTQNYDSTGNSANGSLIPLTHLVAKSETLFKIGRDVNVTPQLIRKWNHLTSDIIAPGTPLIVGYLKTGGDAAALNSLKNSTAVSNTPVVKSETESRQSTAEAKKDDPFTSVTAGAGKEKDAATEATPAKKDNADASTSNRDTALAVVAETPVSTSAKKADKIAETPVKTDVESKKVSAPNTSVNIAGTFEDLYQQQITKKSENTKSGEAATFKSTSGWQDKKYYVLINDVAAGTIVKISSDNKSVYAKVLGSMPEMKENNGLLLRVSNAAASYLGIIDPKFPVQITFYQ